ncbi:MAG TPA: FtsX-like permease family protein, partial [Candidatus Angelobacter sp.]|nr:FtsX-like permease family protein [Candidatus Angelobacter sp.]
QFAALPGVQSVSYSAVALLTGSDIGTDIHLPGTPESERLICDYMPVGLRFFQTMGIPLKHGRDFTAADFAAAAARSARPPSAPADPQAAPATIIVNEAFVRQFLPHTEPLGQHIEETLPQDPQDARGPGWEIIGVAGDTKYDSLRRDIGPTMYMANAGNAFFAVRTAGDPLQLVPAIRDLVNRKDSNLAMFRIATESQQIDNQVSVEQLIARLATFFGLLALVLACVGLYGLLSYEVTRRTREIGIRMAIGAQRSNVIRLVVVQGIMLAAAGAVVGSAASLGVTRLLKTALYGVTPGDPITLALCAAILLLVAMAACYLPARRATKVDPLVALRYE